MYKRYSFFHVLVYLLPFEICRNFKKELVSSMRTIQQKIVRILQNLEQSEAIKVKKYPKENTLQYV